jgi:hypothetical protein
MLSPDQMTTNHVATDRDERLPGKVPSLYTIGAQQPFSLTGTRIGVELVTRIIDKIGKGKIGKIRNVIDCGL